MNTKYLLGIGGVAILAYVLFRNKKKVEVSDLQKEPVNVIPAVIRRKKDIVTLDDLSSNSQSRTGIGGRIKVRNSRLILDQIKVPVKSPIIINPTNLIPNRYDRGVGQEINLAASGEIQGYYENETYSNYCLYFIWLLNSNNKSCFYTFEDLKWDKKFNI